MQVVPGIIVSGKYQVEHPLARGGMGSVWAARHTKLGSAVAIKFLDDHLAADATSLARFEREARATASLDTPNVVRVQDYGVEQGTPYLVMELLRGENLNMRLRQKRRLSLQEASRIISQMSRGLRRAHEVGIVHRDLKPANVFLATVDGEEVVKVLDFGIAKDTWSRVEESTKTGEVFGSPHYMSPEQARAQKNVDHRADVWATGVITYRMITGRLPFPGEALGEVLSSVLVDPFPTIAEAAPDLPAAFDGFFAKALAKKREDRFAQVSELAEAFSAIVASLSMGPASTPLPPRAESLMTFSALHIPPPLSGPPVAAPAPQVDAAIAMAPAPAPLDPQLSLPPPDPYTPSGTGPSIASSSSSVFPTSAMQRRQPVIWLVGGLALCGLLAGAIAIVAGSSQSSTLASPGEHDPKAITSGATVEPARAAPPAVTVEPTGTVQAAAPSTLVSPSSTASAAATQAPSAAPSEAPAGSAAKPVKSPSVVPTSAATSAPKGTATTPRGKNPKAPDPQWGL